MSWISAQMRGTLCGADVAIAYATVVVVLAVVLVLVPQSLANRFVLDSSTNLVNLRQHPPFVLAVSGFVEPSLWQLWTIPFVILVYGEVQRWLGRGPVVVTFLLGHAGATLVVATVLTAGIGHGRIALSQARVTDVGVSYGLVTAAGLLAARVGAIWKRRYVTAISAALLVFLLTGRSFTDLGHLAAWLIGLGLALLVGRAQAAVVLQARAAGVQPEIAHGG